MATGDVMQNCAKVSVVVCGIINVSGQIDTWAKLFGFHVDDAHALK